MSSIAIVTDSNSGISQAEAEKLGIYVLPMPFIINGETYYIETVISAPDYGDIKENVTRGTITRTKSP